MRINKFAVIATAMILLIVAAYCTLVYLYPKNYRNEVEKYAAEYGLNESMVYAIIKCESNFNSEAVSNAGAIGLMQITPDTFKWAAGKEKDTDTAASRLYDAETNIKYGCSIYSLFYGEFEQESTALACYNAGRGRVLSWLSDKEYSEDGILLKSIPYGETDRYVKKVLLTKKIYEFLY